MTTILGIKTGSEEEGIILATDTQINLYDGETHTGKLISSKIRTGKNYAMAFSGNMDKYLEAFFSYIAGNREFDSLLKLLTGKKDSDEFDLLGHLPKNLKKNFQELLKKGASASELERIILKMQKGEIVAGTDIDNFVVKIARKMNEQKSPVENATQSKYFEELAMINRYLLLRDKSADSVELILAVNKPLLELYHVDPFGNVKKVESEEMDYVCLGTGSDLVEKFIDDEQYRDDPKLHDIKIDNLAIPSAIQLAIASLKIASKDVNTGGFIGLTVVQENSIENFSDFIQAEIASAESKAYDEIIKKYLPQPK